MKLTKEKIDLLLNGTREERVYACAKSFKPFCVFYFSRYFRYKPGAQSLITPTRTLTHSPDRAVLPSSAQSSDFALRTCRMGRAQRNPSRASDQSNRVMYISRLR
jgi:hypothetical protein